MMKYITLLITLIFFSFSSYAQFGAPREIIESLGVADDIHSVDIDGDGDVDLVFVYKLGNRIFWYENIDGLGNYGEGRIISSNIYFPESVFSGDLDSDGDIDIVCTAIGDDEVVWFENLDGQGNFSNKNTIVSGFQLNPFEVSISDIDGDNDNDIIYSRSGCIIWYENTNGLGLFEQKQILNDSGTNIKSFEVTDIDNDGDMDIIAGSEIDDTSIHLFWYENTDGLGTFGSTQIIESPNYVRDVCSADIDGDGDMDLVFSTTSSGYSSFLLYWCENTDGLGTFGPSQFISSMNSLKNIVIGDIDSDGDNDILTSAPDNYDEVVWYENTNGLGSFDDFHFFTESCDVEMTHLCDINNNGFLDIVFFSFWSLECSVGIYCVENVEGLGDYGEEQLISWNSIYSPNHIYHADINTDGKMDLITTSNGRGDNMIWQEYNMELDDFGPPQIIAVNNRIYNLIFSDIDVDGDTDFIFSSGDSIFSYKNDGAGNYSQYQSIPSNGDSKNLNLFDFDGDDDLDILYTCRIANVWFENTDGLGNYVWKQSIFSDLYLYDAQAFDIDGDDDLDIVTVSDENIKWYENTDGYGTFGNEVIEISNSSARGTNYSLSIEDVDGDNDLDLLSFFDIKIEWYENIDNQINFGVPHLIADVVDVYEDDLRGMYPLDIDKDGDVDIVTSTYYDFPDKLFWYENNDGYGNFSAQEEIDLSLNHFTALSPYDVDLDGDLDIFVLSSKDVIWYKNLFGAPYMVKGSIFFDSNQNGVKDSIETGFNHIQTILDPNSLASFTNFNGEFWFAVDTGQYFLSYNNLQDLSKWSLTTDSVNYNVEISTLDPIKDSLNFGFYPDTFCTVIYPEITTSNMRCSEENNLWLSYGNLGTTKPNGIIELILDNQISYVNSTILPDSIINNSLFWHFDTLNFFTTEQINLTLLMPDFNSMGNILSTILNIYTIDSTGQLLFTDTLSELLNCSYDPNDKLGSPKGEGVNGIINNTEILEYTVRFQNTGNSEAINIKIEDQLDEDLNIQSLQILASSHDMQAYIDQNRWLIFEFDSIMLPDSTSNFLESQGFVKYSVRLNEDVLPNTQILNTANIYFDYNPAVITNTTINTVDCYLNNTGDTAIQVCDNFEWHGVNFSDSDTLTHVFTNIYGCDSIATLYLTIKNSTPSVTDTRVACNSFTWIDGVTYTENNNTVTHTLTNISGCDSVVTLDLTINTVNTAVTVDDPDISSDATGAAYQWMDCNDDFSILVGEVYQDLTTPNNGDFAVEVEENGCVDTSACVNITTVGIKFRANHKALNIYPNPTTGIVTIEGFQINSIEISNISGQIISKQYLKNNKIKLDLSNQSKGFYFVKIVTINYTITKIIILE